MYHLYVFDICINQEFLQKSTFKNWPNSCDHELAKREKLTLWANWFNSFINWGSVEVLLSLINLILLIFFLVRAPPQIRRPNREVRPLRKEMPGGGARGPVGRAHPISKSEKPSTSRDKDCRARGRDDKASLPLPDSFTLSPWPWCIL